MTCRPYDFQGIGAFGTKLGMDEWMVRDGEQKIQMKDVSEVEHGDLG